MVHPHRPTAAVTNLSYKSLISVQRATIPRSGCLPSKLVSYYVSSEKFDKRVGEL